MSEYELYWLTEFTLIKSLPGDAHTKNYNVCFEVHGMY